MKLGEMTSEDSGADSASKPKRFTEKEKQTLQYVNQLMSHGLRSYGTTVLVEKSTVRLWYCDRMGLIISEPFNFIEKPHLLALLSIAILTADLESLGLCPYLHFPESNYTSFDGATFKLDTALDANGDEIAGGVEFNVRDTERVKLHNGLGAVGRGTTVFPVEIPRALTARLGADNVMTKVAWPFKGRPAEASYIRIIRRKLENDLEGRKYLRHITDLRCSLEQTAAQIGLPRVAMSYAPFTEEGERICRTIVAKAYAPLNMVNSVNEFKTIFIGAMQGMSTFLFSVSSNAQFTNEHVGHRWAWTVARVLHRDISIGNIMFYRADAEVIGVLNDWDNAVKESKLPLNNFDLLAEIKAERDKRERNIKRSTTSPNQNVIQSPNTTESNPHLPNASQWLAIKQARYRTGTGPFMAIELLLPGRVPFHRYRYDLESFFYVLVWFCVGFDSKARNIRHIDDWQYRDFKLIAAAKALFLQSNQEYNALLAGALDEECRQLAQKWVIPIRNMLHKVVRSHYDLDALVNSCSVQSLPKIERNIESLKQEAAGYINTRETTFTFEKFMDVLLDEE